MYCYIADHLLLGQIPFSLQLRLDRDRTPKEKSNRATLDIFCGRLATRVAEHVARRKSDLVAKDQKGFTPYDYSRLGTKLATLLDPQSVYGERWIMEGVAQKLNKELAGGHLNVPHFLGQYVFPVYYKISNK